MLVWKVHNGLRTECREYATKAEALKAVGLADWAMSANVDLVRSLFAAWERGDYSAADWAHPEIEYVIADGPSPGIWTGMAGMAAGFRELASPWEELRVEVDEYRELDDERVLVLVRRSGRSKTSGLELGQLQSKGAHLFHVRGGKLTRQVVYWDRERAFADLGLAPESGAPAP
jgi:ketosteroid isomerase-like protein